MAYIATMYDHSNANCAWYAAQLPTLVERHRDDPADEDEFERALRVGNHQGNLNPFIVDPTLLERVNAEG